MAYSVNWLTRVVFVPTADLTFISAAPEIYELSVFDFWQNIHNIQDSFEAMGQPDIMESGAPTSFAPRGVEIINNYRIEFEDGQYEVKLTNGNSDIQQNRIPNQVSISSTITTGLSAEAVAASVWSEVLSPYITETQAGYMLHRLLKIAEGDQRREGNRFRVWEKGADKGADMPIIDKDVAGGQITAPPIDLDEHV